MDVFGGWCGETAWSGCAFDVFRLGWAIYFGMVGNFDDEFAWGNEGGNFGIAKFFEQSKEVSVDGFVIEVFARLKVAGYSGGLNAGVNGGGIKGE